MQSELGLDGGHMWGAELGLDQLHVMRPSPKLARYASGISRLYLGGSGMHPAGHTLGAGALAAAAVLGG